MKKDCRMSLQSFYLEKKQGRELSSRPCGARGGSRTRTPLRAPAPEAGESTNSTTRASGVSPFVQRQAVYYHDGRKMSSIKFKFLDIYFSGICVQRVLDGP